MSNVATVFTQAADLGLDATILARTVDEYSGGMKRKIVFAASNYEYRCLVVVIG